MISVPTIAVRLLTACSLLVLVACAGSPEQTASSEAVTSAAEAPASPCACPAPDPRIPVSDMLVVGEVEYIVIGDNILQQKARVDTGAATTSLGIQSLEAFERDGERWVRFTIQDRVSDESVDFERRLVRMVKIKRHNATPDERPVVTMALTIGPVKRTIEVTLNNRDSFEYPVLVGRNFLDGHVVVDVSSKYIALDREAS